MTASDDVPTGVALVALTAAGLALAHRLEATLPGARTHGLAHRAAGADVAFEDTATHLRRLFQDGTPIVGLCAAGILVRALAPVIADKRREPPVVAVGEDGAAAVPLIGGHHGANALARVIAAATGGVAAITTAGELRLGLALHDPPPGWRVGNPEMVKPVTAALLAGEPVALALEAGPAEWLAPLPFAAAGRLTVRVTDRAAGADDALCLHPAVLAVGVGCERDTAPDELAALVADALAAAGIAADAVACLASIDLKLDEPAVHAAAAALGVAARFFAAAELEAERPRLATPSEAVYRETGCHGVAEGAALAAAGSAATLVVPKRKSRRATCAIARAPAPIDPTTVGRARGRLAILGIGPGAAEARTPAVSAALQRADEVVGYGLYLDLLGDAIGGKARHDSPLGAEQARARLALDRAATGRAVAVVSSGDAGIYAMAALAFELLDREDRPDWNRVEIAVEPGVSALQAAAARAGAPLGHDFCAVSLSDLMTPWTVIERRLRAAAAGDFVVALFNPVSARRRTQLNDARDILMAARPTETPVLLARDIGRAGERVSFTTLGELTPEVVDMLTLVIVGNSMSRRITRGRRQWLYTPRGYALDQKQKN
jgi:cobalt-precorrin 5A hydrolase/precorrin-3B C17-methyltransferase